MITFTFISLPLLISAIVLAIPVFVFVLEVCASFFISQRNQSLSLKRDSKSRVAVIIPAHNEGAGLVPTLHDVKAGIRPDDCILVVADNCSDDTSAVAASHGAAVFERNEPTRRGKGFAIAAGLKHLTTLPPDIVIVIDADCRLEPGALELLAATCTQTNRPVQANYVMRAPAGAAIKTRVAEFAHLVKDTVRPLGLKAFRLPCQLAGTGMAFPWEVIRSVDLESGSLVEDLKLGLDLARTGHPPIYQPWANVYSEFPSSDKGLQSQRLRWEQGHLRMILVSAPLSILAALSRANLELLAMALDMAVPPLTLLLMLSLGISFLAACATLVGASIFPFFVSAISTLSLSFAVFVIWLGYGRDILPPHDALSILQYVLGKLGIYTRIFSSRSPSEWVRTDREKH